MDKVYTYLMIVTVVSLFLYLGGYGSSGSVFTVIGQIINGGSFESNSFWLVIYGILGFVGAAVLVQSAIAGNSSAAIAGGAVTMSLFLVSFISDIVYVINTAAEACDIAGGGLCQVTYWIIVVICVPLALGFAYSLGEMVFGGND